MRSTWADDYPTDFGYTYGNFPELSPAHIQFALANVGILPPSTQGEFNYCELGFGQGVTLNVLGCAYPHGSFSGNDFNPEHVRFARTMQAASRSDVLTFEDSFEALCSRELPEFDFIVAHGVWSWVNPDQWQHVARFVRERLRPGGVFYVSYNALPGWAKFMPMHELISTMSRLGVPAETGSGARLTRTLALTKTVVDQNSGYFEINPAAKERFEKLGRENPHYLAHEYLNQHWTPTYFHQVDRCLREAKLTYACQGQLLSHLDFLELGPEQLQYLQGIESPVLRETVRDYLCNRQFRRDLYVKGPARLSSAEHREQLMGFAFALRVPAHSISLTVSGPLGKADLEPELYGEVIARLEANLAGATPLHEFVNDAVLRRHGFGRIYQALFMLVAKGDVAVVKETVSRDAKHPAAEGLNRWILDQATHNLGLPLLVDPISGSALQVEQVEQLFLHGIEQGVDDERLLIDYAETMLTRTGRRADARGELPLDEAQRRAVLRERLEDLLGGMLQLLVARHIVRSPAAAGLARRSRERQPRAL